MSKRISPSESNKYGNEYAQIATSGLDVLDAAYHTAHSYPGGIPALAVRMMMSPNTLAHKVDPSKKTHLLGLKESIAIQAISRDKSILHSMASALGCLCIDMSSCDDKTVLQEVSEMVKDFGKTIMDMQEAVTDGSVTANEMHKCEADAFELMAAINGALGSIRSMMPKRDH